MERLFLIRTVHHSPFCFGQRVTTDPVVEAGVDDVVDADAGHAQDGGDVSAAAVVIEDERGRGRVTAAAATRRHSVTVTITQS